MEWDSSPIYRPLYSWYLGAVQQWHAALLFVPLIVTMKEPEPELDRVWKVLDCKSCRFARSTLTEFDRRVRV